MTKKEMKAFLINPSLVADEEVVFLEVVSQINKENRNYLLELLSEQFASSSEEIFNAHIVFAIIRKINEPLRQQQDEYGNSMLHYLAVMYKDTPYLRDCFTSGIDFSLKNEGGLTVFDYLKNSVLSSDKKKQLQIENEIKNIKEYFENIRTTCSDQNIDRVNRMIMLNMAGYFEAVFNDMSYQDIANVYKENMAVFLGYVYQPEILQVLIDKGLTPDVSFSDYGILISLEEWIPREVSNRLYQKYEKGISYEDFLNEAAEHVMVPNNYDELLTMVQNNAELQKSCSM